MVSLRKSKLAQSVEIVSGQFLAFSSSQSFVESDGSLSREQLSQLNRLFSWRFPPTFQRQSGPHPKTAALHESVIWCFQGENSLRRGESWFRLTVNIVDRLLEVAPAYHRLDGFCSCPECRDLKFQDISWKVVQKCCAFTVLDCVVLPESSR